MLATLRTEDKALEPGVIISTADGLKNWEIVREPLMMIDPYSAYERREQHKEQGIRDYLIKPIDGCEKPPEGELLLRG